MKMNKIAFVVISAICAFTFFSCDLLLSPLPLPSILEQYSPEPSADSLSEVPTEELVAAANDVSVVADPDVARAVLEALGARVDVAISAADQDDADAVQAAEEGVVSSLTEEEQSAVLSLTTSAILPMNTLMSAVSDLLPTLSGGDNRMVESTEVPVQRDEVNVENMNMSTIVNIATRIISNAHFVDTRWTETYLLYLMRHDRVPSNRRIPNVLFATLSVALSACKSNLRHDYTDILNAVAAEDYDGVYAEFEEALGALQNSLGNFEREEPLTESDAVSAANTILTALSEGGVVNPVAKRELKNALLFSSWLYSKDIDYNSILQSMRFRESN